MRFSKVTLWCAVILSITLAPALGFCSVESSLIAIQTKLVNVLMPLAAILGLCFSAFSFFSGNPSARTHMWLSILGACIGFGSSSIISLIRSLVH